MIHYLFMSKAFACAILDVQSCDLVTSSFAMLVAVSRRSSRQRSISYYTHNDL